MNKDSKGWTPGSDTYRRANLVSKINATYYKPGIKVINYGSHALNTSVTGNDTVALLEFDLGYISVPMAEFK